MVAESEKRKVRALAVVFQPASSRRPVGPRHKSKASKLTSHYGRISFRICSIKSHVAAVRCGNPRRSCEIEAIHLVVDTVFGRRDFASHTRLIESAGQFRERFASGLRSNNVY